jgi:hypothetical protein
MSEKSWESIDTPDLKAKRGGEHIIQPVWNALRG